MLIRLCIRAGRMDYWCQQRANKAAHGRDMPVTHNPQCALFQTPLFSISDVIQWDKCVDVRMWGSPQTHQFSFLCTPSTVNAYPPPFPPPWALILHSMPHSWHMCISDYARRVEVIPAWISILMGCPLCPCFLSLRFHSSKGEEEAMQMGRKMPAEAQEPHLGVRSSGGTNN